MPYKVLVEDFEVIPRLAEWRLPKEIMLDILDRAVGERANVIPSDPAATAGMEMRRWITRFLRDAPHLKELGWTSCVHAQLEGIRNDDLGIKLVSLNTDSRTGMPLKEPASVAEKGPAAEEYVKRNKDCRQYTLFNDEPPSDPLLDYDFLYFCVYAGDDYISAEISRPSGMNAGFVNSFSERVILSQPGEKLGLRHPKPIPEDFAEIDKPSVVRRR